MMYINNLTHIDYRTQNDQIIMTDRARSGIDSLILRKIDSIVSSYPEIDCLRSILDSDLNITEEFLGLYFKTTHPKKSLILRQLVGETRQLKESQEYYTIRGLQYLLNNPEAPLDEMRHGNAICRDLIPKSLSTQLEVPRTRYYAFTYEYSTKALKLFPDCDEIKYLADKILRYFVLEDRTAIAFAGGYTTNKRIGHYFPESNLALSTLNTLTFMKALIPEIKGNLKAQDKLPACVYKLMGLKCRSIPQALAFTDILVMHYIGISKHNSRISELSGCLRRSQGMPFCIQSLATAVASDLSKYFFIRLEEDYSKIGGNSGSSFQFNLGRLVGQEWQIDSSFIEEYRSISNIEMIRYISANFNGNPLKLFNLLEVIDSDKLSGIDVRDYVNIIIHAENLRRCGDIDLIKSSAGHYSKVLPSVAQFKLGRKEATKTDSPKRSAARRNNKERTSFKIEMFEECIRAIAKSTTSLEITDPFIKFWNDFSACRNTSISDKALAFEIWKALSNQS